jgi:hypothetical protein
MQAFTEQEQVVRLLKGVQFNRDQHGGLYDRGSADSYYSRPRDPHWYPLGTYNGEKVTDLTASEVAEYNAGYDDNEAHGDKKDWY